MLATGTGVIGTGAGSGRVICAVMASSVGGRRGLGCGGRVAGEHQALPGSDQVGVRPDDGTVGEVGAVDEPRQVARRCAAGPRCRERRQRLSPGRTSTCCRGGEYAEPVGLAGTGSVGPRVTSTRRVAWSDRRRRRGHRSPPPGRRRRPAPRRAPRATRAGRRRGNPAGEVKASLPDGGDLEDGRCEDHAQPSQPPARSPRQLRRPAGRRTCAVAGCRSVAVWRKATAVAPTDAVTRGVPRRSDLTMLFMLNAFVCLRLRQTTLRLVLCQSFVHRPFGPGGTGHGQRHEVGRVDVRRVRRPRAAGGGAAPHGARRRGRRPHARGVRPRQPSPRGCTPHSDTTCGSGSWAVAWSPVGSPGSGRTGCCWTTASRSGWCDIRDWSRSAGCRRRPTVRTRGRWSTDSACAPSCAGWRRPASSARCTSATTSRSRGASDASAGTSSSSHVGDGADGVAQAIPLAGVSALQGREELRRWCDQSRGVGDPSTNGCSRTNCSVSA